jgi:intracellular multiplication protein IcmL
MSQQPQSAAAKRPSSPASSPQTMAPMASDVRNAYGAFNQIKRRIHVQNWIIFGLVCFLALVIPFAKTIEIFFAVTPENKARKLLSLEMPNMTNRAVLSWATTSITEVMTMGFGDMDLRLPRQRVRFTSAGWESYMHTFNAMNIRENFKQSQLVLTTVPSNTPVIVWQGVNEDKVYQWVMQMPVIMTYATNNNVTRKDRGTVHLTIVRVPTQENFFGIAIKRWYLI